MTRYLLALPLFCASLAATDITTLIPYLDANSTGAFSERVTTPGEANAKRPDNNKSILMYAVWVGNEPAVRHLIDRGADVNAKDSQGVTALLLAIFKDHTAIATLLIRSGADVNATADDGTTPLIMSRIRQNKTVEDALLEAVTPPQHKEDE